MMHNNQEIELQGGGGNNLLYIDAARLAAEKKKREKAQEAAERKKLFSENEEQCYKLIAMSFQMEFALPLPQGKEGGIWNAMFALSVGCMAVLGLLFLFNAVHKIMALPWFVALSPEHVRRALRTVTLTMLIGALVRAWILHGTTASILPVAGVVVRVLAISFAGGYIGKWLHGFGAEQPAPGA